MQVAKVTMLSPVKQAARNDCISNGSAELLYEIAYKGELPKDFYVTLLEVDRDGELGLRAFSKVESALECLAWLIIRHRFKRLIGQLTPGALVTWKIDYDFEGSSDGAVITVGMTIDAVTI
jgi:hypothetical protein